MNATRLKLEWAILLALAIAGALYAQANGLTGRLDNQLFDTASPLARPDLDRDIVIVAIDDASLAEVGAWPWPRDVHARLVDRLHDAGARAVVLDILFLEPVPGGGDDALAAAMTGGGAVFLPHTFAARPNAISGIDPLMPLPRLLGASAGVGHVIAEPDADGVLRRFDLTVKTDTGLYPHLAVKVLDVLAGNAAKHADETPDEALIVFHPEADFQRVPAAEVLAGATPAGFFRNKIVLVGATAQGMGDRYSVAAGPVSLMSGIGIQANLIGALRDDALIAIVDPAVQGIVAVAVLLALFLAFWHLPPRFLLLGAAGLIAVLLAVSLALLGAGQLWFAPGPIMAAVSLSYPLWSWRRLTNVSRYLDREAARLAAGDAAPVASQGVDYVTRQIDQLRRLISTVRGSLDFLRQVIEAAPDAIVVLDRAGRIEMLNHKALQLFPGWTAPRHQTFAELVRGADAQQSKSGTELQSADGRTFLIARARIAAADEIEGGSDGGAGEIIALRNVSELRRLDDERQQMLEFLSHDMRTPQVAIVGLTNQASAQGVDRDVVGRIRKQAERTLKLADDFVQLARLESADLAIMDSDIGALVEEACDRAYALAQTKRITIAQDLPPEPCFANVDASLIARMLDNLIGNAIKYSDAGTQIAVALSGGEDAPLVLEVSDQGPGLSDARLANPFARFGAHATHAGPSAGLGLALVKKVVDSHKGTIAMKSAPGEGTTFTVTIPGEQAR